MELIGYASILAVIAIITKPRAAQPVMNPAQSFIDNSRWAEEDAYYEQQLAQEERFV